MDTPQTGRPTMQGCKSATSTILRNPQSCAGAYSRGYAFTCLGLKSEQVAAPLMVAGVAYGRAHCVSGHYIGAVVRIHGSRQVSIRVSTLSILLYAAPHASTPPTPGGSYHN